MYLYNYVMYYTSTTSNTLMISSSLLSLSLYGVRYPSDPDLESFSAAAIERVCLRAAVGVEGGLDVEGRDLAAERVRLCKAAEAVGRDLAVEVRELALREPPCVPEWPTCLSSIHRAERCGILLDRLRCPQPPLRYR